MTKQNIKLGKEEEKHITRNSPEVFSRPHKHKIDSKYLHFWLLYKQGLTSLEENVVPDAHFL